MAKYNHPDLMDFGLDFLRESAAARNVDLVLLKAYSQGDAYATVVTNEVMSIDLADTDFTLSDQGTLGRQVTIGAKSGTAIANSGVTPDLHGAIVDRTDSKVLAVHDEPTDREIFIDDVINLSAYTIKANQPT